MTRRVVSWIVLGALATGLGWLPQAAMSATTKAEQNQTAARMVEEALRNEVTGSDADRNKVLHGVLEQSPAYAPALWHSGFVHERNKWVKFDEASKLSADDERLTAYRRVRQQYPDSVDGHLELAEWCAKKKLVDQQRAHLTRVLELNPDHVEARRLLGYRRVEGKWFSEQEIAQANQQAKQSSAALRQWKSKVTEIRNGLAARSVHQREAAAQRLQAIDDPAAIESLELVLARDNEEAALLVVKTLARMTAPGAAVALARQAVFSPWESVRDAAAKELKGKDLQNYVPEMLAAMSATILSRAELYTAPTGRLMYRHSFLREGQDRSDMVVLETEYMNNVLSGDGASREMLEAARRRDAITKTVSRETTVGRQNDLIERMNERISEALSKATGQYVTAAPDAWWKWWNDYNEVLDLGTKPTDGVYARERVAFANPYSGPSGSSGGSGGRSTGRSGAAYECLVAGTLVWTDVGPTAIEEIKVGDRVLSQDAESGELGFKPVLRTSTRPPTALLRIQAGGEPIQCSGGHPFWVSGDGWTKARFLKPQSQLHCVTGTAQIRSIEESGFETTYNLVVADFHTYFVGKGKVLTHDNTIRKPASTVVPGLKDE